jgi:hypothetical protein
MSEVKGYCCDCFWKRQEWVLTDEKLMLDRWCDVFDVFVPENGWCWCFKEEVRL